jgi:hypothetical protein
MDCENGRHFLISERVAVQPFNNAAAGSAYLGRTYARAQETPSQHNNAFAGGLRETLPAAAARLAAMYS